MTPTQEQILKDALEIIATDEKTYIGHGDYYEGPFSGEYCQRVARKALTAIEAAAGVGEKSLYAMGQSGGITYGTDADADWGKRENVIDATVERCAQVAYDSPDTITASRRIRALISPSPVAPGK
jgi:hypothetical protein